MDEPEDQRSAKDESAPLNSDHLGSEDHFQGPRDAFMHLISLITLYFSALGAGVAGVLLAERFVPDPLAEYYDTLEPMRVAIATLLVSFPIFLISSRMIGKRISEGTMDPGTKLRKILTYFTLFVISVTGIVTVIAILYSFLDGEITARFLIKAASVLIVLGLAFWYSLGELRLTKGQATTSSLYPQRVALIVISSVLVLGLLAAGVAVAGLPSDARKAEMDMRRIAHVNALNHFLEAHYQSEGSLPDDLDRIAPDLQRQFDPGRDPRRDPGTGRPFEYRRIDARTYEICVTFETDDSRRDRYFYPEAFVDHGVGRHCYEQVVAERQPPPTDRESSPLPEPSPTPTF